MFPVHAIFPEFVPDQVLTSDDLNNLFGFLDEQGRMTRTNLIGIGIVCGLQIKTAADKSWITITKGVGVTSEGYLIRIDQDITSTAFKAYDPVKDDYYEKFVNEAANPKTSKFTLWELRPDITDGGNNLADISAGLENYIVLLFVELLKEHNKNCDPNSCDDKGINVTMTFRPLLVAKNEPLLNTLIGSTGNPASFSPFYTLPDIRMPRYDVPNTFPIQTEQVLKPYIDILTQTFLDNVETKLTSAFTTFGAFLGNPGGTSPFNGLKSSFNFISNITTKNQLLHLQYYYDIISDLLLAYNEFRKTGNGILSTCAPDITLFPRHLLLGEAVPAADMISSYRHYFIYSPLFEKKNLLMELKFLFSKMVLMKNNIFIPPFVPAASAPDDGVRITPSKLNDVPLSDKAIPYYYKPLQLFPSWNFDKTLRGKGNQNLSYHATMPGYNTDDDFVRNPLEYDLEPYNFLRIEGHIGLKYQEVIQQINMLKTFFRLPIDVIALSTGEANLSNIANAIVSCNIRDLQTSYEIIRREWEAIIGKMIEYLHDNQNDAKSILSEASVGTDVVADYLILLNKAKEFMVPELLVFISKYNEFLVPVYEEVEKQSLQLRTAVLEVINNQDIGIENMPLAEDMIDHFDEVILSCKKGGFRSIYQQFNSRLNEIYSYMFFSRFTEKHPGIQHKAGVPMGGTFIIVYHKKPEVAETKGPFTITGFARTPGGQAISAGFVQVKNTNITTFLNTSGSFTIVVNFLPAILTAFNFFGQFQTGELLISSPNQSPVTIQVPSAPVVIGNGGNNVYNSLNNDDVIADFYLPYICSSNCTPIQFVIQETINQTPLADAGPAQEITLPQNSAVLDGTASKDPENKPLQFSWALVSSQQNVAISDPASAKPVVSNLIEPGDYTFELTVTDEDGASHTDQVIITIIAEPNLAPTANAGENQIIRQPASTTVLNGQGTDPENRPLTFAWTLISGPIAAVGFSAANAAQTTVSNLTSTGAYIFRLTVTDEKLLTATDDIIVTVAANGIPVVEAGEDITHVFSPVANNNITFNGSGSDPDGDPVTFLWSGPSQFSIQTPASASTVVSGLVPGSYNFVLTVTDSQGASATDNVSVNVVEPPIANAGEERVVDASEDLTLDGSGSSDPDGGPVTFNWIKISGPDGETFDPSLQNPVVTGIKAGTYVFELTVTDADGLTSKDRVTINVNREVPQRSCAPLADIIKAFNELNGLDTPDNFQIFRLSYESFPEITAFYKEMEERGIALLPVDEQVEFFLSQDISNRLIRWLKDLEVIILQSFESRVVSLTMLNIHAQLIYYIACMQPEDVNNAKAPMAEPLQSLAALLENLTQLLPTFTQPQKDVLKNLLAITTTELNRVISNGEQAAKPVYVRLLNRIIRILNAMAL